MLSADVVGYGLVMGADEEGALTRLKAHRRLLVDRKLSEYHGRIVKTTGDGMLVEFASALDAVCCAVDIQREMAEENAHLSPDKQIEFRVGINVGDIPISHSGRVFGNSVNVAVQLENIAEPGGICVSGQVKEDVEGKLDILFEDNGEQQLRNIATPVRVYRLQLKGVTLRHAPVVADRPSIAVLPFENLSEDPRQEYFADGMVEDITSALSRIRWLFVIARNSSFAYKGKTIDVKQVGRELGVRYVLEGSIRKSKNQVRITGQLIDASTGGRLWAGRSEGNLEDIFGLQDQITESVVGQIAPELERARLIAPSESQPRDWMHTIIFSAAWRIFISRQMKPTVKRYGSSIRPSHSIPILHCRTVWVVFVTQGGKHVAGRPTTLKNWPRPNGWPAGRLSWAATMQSHSIRLGLP
jgi:adenylate cyclase